MPRRAAVAAAPMRKLWPAYPAVTKAERTADKNPLLVIVSGPQTLSPFYFSYLTFVWGKGSDRLTA